MITKLLPSSLPGSDPRNVSGKNITVLSADHDFAVLPTQMGFIRHRLKELHDEYGSSVTLWIHLGQWKMDFVSCERRAFRQDFISSWSHHMSDKHYYTLPDSAEKSVDDLGPNPWLAVPTGLHSEVPIDATVLAANSVLEKDIMPLKVASHHEAGSAGCGYTFYESMANCFVAGRRRDVIFVHVPPDADAPSLEKARDAVLAIIGAAVHALVEQRHGKTEEKIDTDLALGSYLDP